MILITINYVTNFKKILSGRKEIILKNHVYNFFENLVDRIFLNIAAKNYPFSTFLQTELSHLKSSRLCESQQKYCIILITTYFLLSNFPLFLQRDLLYVCFSTFFFHRMLQAITNLS